MEGCTHNCETCKANCSGRANKIEKLKLPEGVNIKKIIAISSGKGGVGKSFVTSTIASALNKEGYSVGILDGDILGPSIPKSFNIDNSGLMADEDNLMMPKVTDSGIKIISANLLLDENTQPIIYRGSLISSVLQQFYNQVAWGMLDYLLIDMPPGTGDVPLTAYQMIPVDKVIIVTSPQDLVSMIVEKSINMAKMMKIDILGIVENMSYVECPKCKEKIEIFGKGKIDEVAKKTGVKVLAKLPMRMDNCKLVDEGKVENIELDELKEVMIELRKLL